MQHAGPRLPLLAVALLPKQMLFNPLSQQPFAGDGPLHPSEEDANY